MVELTERWLIELGFQASMANIMIHVMMGLLVLLLSALADFLVKRFAVTTVKIIISRTRTTWDDAILERRVLDRIGHLAPALVIYRLKAWPLAGYPEGLAFVDVAVYLYVIVIGSMIIDAMINAGHDIYQKYPMSREVPAKSFVQVTKLILFLATGLWIVSVLLQKNPVYFLSGLGALTAVLLLVFKDAILGFVAGIQLSANKMVAVGDWIEMPKYGADGDVIEVALTTVKVQNWDKTVTTIPTYALISDSFKNWRGMFQAGGRRIKRAVYLDLQTIKFCDEDMLKRFAKIKYISEYIQKKKDELEKYNSEQQVDNTSLVNGRRMTNIGTFRAYVTAYLKHHPKIHQEMTFLVRQLAPDEKGLPIEIYVFTNDTAWANYEAIQADIFDHILAVVPEFDLRVFQNPSGNDFRALGDKAKN